MNGTELVLLGTAGGRTWAGGTERRGISSALVVDDDVYLVDCGEGWGRQYRAAGLGAQGDFAGLERLRAVFITHLHADHVVDYPNLLLFGLNDGLGRRGEPVVVVGPGSRGVLPPMGVPGAEPREVVSPGSPVPGIEEMTDRLLEAFANDLNDNIRNNLKPHPREVLSVRDIVLPDIPGLDPDLAPAPDMEPFVIHRDDKVTVSAVLVNHAPAFPAFAFRFDTPHGSVAFSGDTNACPNMVRLSAGVDCMVHQTVSTRWVEALFPEPRTDAQEAKIRHLRRSHTTLDEVAKIAAEARVGTVVLSHIGPANMADAQWQDEIAGLDPTPVLGRDLMRFRIDGGAHLVPADD